MRAALFLLVLVGCTRIEYLGGSTAAEDAAGLRARGCHAPELLEAERIIREHPKMNPQPALDVATKACRK